MAEMHGGKGNALSDKGKRSKSDVHGKENGQPVQGLGLTRSASAGTPKGMADLNRKGSRKS